MNDLKNKKIENELAEAIFNVLVKNNVRTSYHENGNAVFLELHIECKYLYNMGVAKLIDLEIDSKISEHNKN